MSQIHNFPSDRRVILLDGEPLCKTDYRLDKAKRFLRRWLRKEKVSEHDIDRFLDALDDMPIGSTAPDVPSWTTVEVREEVQEAVRGWLNLRTEEE